MGLIGCRSFSYKSKPSRQDDPCSTVSRVRKGAETYPWRARIKFIYLPVCYKVTGFMYMEHMYST